MSLLEPLSPMKMDLSFSRVILTIRMDMRVREVRQARLIRLTGDRYNNGSQICAPTLRTDDKKLSLVCARERQKSRTYIRSV